MQSAWIYRLHVVPRSMAISIPYILKLEIIEIGMRVRFIVPLQQPIPLLSRGAQPKSRVESGIESEIAIQILTFLKKKLLSKSEIAEALGKTKPTRYLNDLMKRLLETNKVEYTIPDKPSSHLQRYRLQPRRMKFFLIPTIQNPASISQNQAESLQAGLLSSRT